MWSEFLLTYLKGKNNNPIPVITKSFYKSRAVRCREGQNQQHKLKPPFQTSLHTISKVMYFDATMVFVTSPHFYSEWLWPYCAAWLLCNDFGYMYITIYASIYVLILQIVKQLKIWIKKFWLTEGWPVTTHYNS